MTDRAAYDYRGLGRVLRDRLEADGRGWRACAPEIGVTSSDLSRVSSGQAVAAHKIFAICDWLGCDPRAWYQPPEGAATRDMFHGERTETGGLSR